MTKIVYSNKKKKKKSLLTWVRAKDQGPGKGAVRCELMSAHPDLLFLPGQV